MLPRRKVYVGVKFGNGVNSSPGGELKCYYAVKSTQKAQVAEPVHEEWKLVKS